MKSIKWILSGLVPAFAAGSAILSIQPVPNFTFWWAVTSAFVGGLASKGINHGIDKSERRNSEES
jgi:hypothetical protein